MEHDKLTMVDEKSDAQELLGNGGVKWHHLIKNTELLIAFCGTKVREILTTTEHLPNRRCPDCTRLCQNHPPNW